MTKRESILAAIQTKLEAVNSPVDLSDRVFRSRKKAVSRAEAPAVIIEPIRDDNESETIYRLTWSLVVRVSLIVRGDIPDQVADPIIEAIHAAIMTDVSLGGLSMDIEPGSVNFELLEVDAGGGVIPIDYTVVYQTARESMTSI